MTTASDVIAALTGVHEKIARDLDNAPTGVTPGYNARVGATINPNGTLRFASEFPGALVYADSVQTVTNDSDMNVSFDLSNSAAYDSGGFYSAGAPTRLTVPATGYYSVWGHTVWEAGSTGYRSVTLKQFNASNVLQRFISQSNVAAVPTVTAIHDAWHPAIRLIATDYVTFVVRHTQGGDLDIQLSTAFALIRVG
jgi:hypothetical protein